MSNLAHRVVIPANVTSAFIDRLTDDDPNSLARQLLFDRRIPVVIHAEDINSFDKIAVETLGNIDILLYLNNRSCGHITMIHDEVYYESEIILSKSDEKINHLAIPSDSYKISIEHIEVEPDIRMIDQMSNYKVYTSSVRIIDKYIFSDSRSIDAMLNYVERCFKGDPQVEIILDRAFIRPNVCEYFLSRIADYTDLFRVYNIVNPRDRGFFHDRLLWCDWYVLKMGRGFTLLKNVSMNTCDGRLLSNKSSTWFKIFETWNHFIQNCELLDLYAIVSD